MAKKAKQGIEPNAEMEEILNPEVSEQPAPTTRVIDALAEESQPAPAVSEESGDSEDYENRLSKCRDRMAATRAETEELVQKYNEYNQEKRYDKLAAVNDDIDQHVKDYQAFAWKECSLMLSHCEDPMLAAVKQLNYKVIRIVDGKASGIDADIPVRSIEEVERPINLLQLHKDVKGGIGVNKQWNYEVEKLNFLLTVQTAKDLGIDPKEINDSYAMSQIAREINMGKTPTSNTNLLKTIQRIVTAMIGEGYKATSHDVNFLHKIYTRKSRRALCVACANHKFMRQYMMEVCHHIVTGNPYSLDYKKQKK